MELKNVLPWEEVSRSGLFANKGRTSDGGGFNKGKSSSEYKANIISYNFKEKGNFRRDCLLLKKSDYKVESMDGMKYSREGD